MRNTKKNSENSEYESVAFTDLKTTLPNAPNILCVYIKKVFIILFSAL